MLSTLYSVPSKSLSPRIISPFLHIACAFSIASVSESALISIDRDNFSMTVTAYFFIPTSPTFLHYWSQLSSYPFSILLSILLRAIRPVWGRESSNGYYLLYLPIRKPINAPKTTAIINSTKIMLSSEMVTLIIEQCPNHIDMPTQEYRRK